MNNDHHSPKPAGWDSLGKILLVVICLIAIIYHCTNAASNYRDMLKYRKVLIDHNLGKWVTSYYGGHTFIIITNNPPDK